jgi:hypothetical protein
VIVRPGAEDARRAAQYGLYLVGEPCVTALRDPPGTADGNLSEGGIDARGEHLLTVGIEWHVDRLQGAPEDVAQLNAC